MSFVQEYKELSDSEKEELKEYAIEEMAAFNIEGTPLKYIKSQLT